MILTLDKCTFKLIQLIKIIDLLQINDPDGSQGTAKLIQLINVIDLIQDNDLDFGQMYFEVGSVQLIEIIDLLQINDIDAGQMYFQVDSTYQDHCICFKSMISTAARVLSS